MWSHSCNNTVFWYRHVKYIFTAERPRWSSVSSGDVAAARPRWLKHISSCGRVRRPAVSWRWRATSAEYCSLWCRQKSVPVAQTPWCTGTDLTARWRVALARRGTTGRSNRTDDDAALLALNLSAILSTSSPVLLPATQVDTSIGYCIHCGK